MRDVLEIGHPLLAEPAGEVATEAVGSPSVQRCIDALIEAMRRENGAGIAANQLGFSQRIFVVEVRADNPRYPYKPPIPLTVLINPVITPLSDNTFENYEGCLSVPQLRGVVRRHLEISVEGLDRHGNALAFEVKGYCAATFQHELDHLDGILFPHRVTDARTFCSWRMFKDYHQAAFAERVRALVAQYGA